MQRNTIKIYTITYSNGSLAKDCFCIRECDDGRLLAVETIAEQLVDLQTKSFLTRECIKLLIIRIGRNLGHSLDT